VNSYNHGLLEVLFALTAAGWQHKLNILTLLYTLSFGLLKAAIQQNTKPTNGGNRG
jgi:hypothetical protein